MTVQTIPANERSRHLEVSAFRRVSLTRRLLLIGFLIPLALDVKKMDEDSGSFLQVFLLATTLFCGALYLLVEWSSTSHRTYKSSLRPTTMAWWVFIAVSPLPAMLWTVETDHYLKVLLPFLLFGVALTIMNAVERRNVDPKQLLDIIVWGALLSTLWRALYAVVISGLSIETMRWEILSPAIPFLIGYGAAGLYLTKSRTMALLALTAAAVVVAISVTRSYLITALFVFIGIFLIDARRRSLVRAARSSMKISLLLVPAAAATVAAIWYARPDVLGVWIERLTNQTTDTGLDITLVARLAEYRGQLDAMTQNAYTFLLGNGIGADYLLNDALLAALSFQHDDSAQWFAGHSTWIYSFFSSGVIVGAIVPVVLLLVLIRGYFTSISRQAFADNACTTFLIYLAYIGQSFTSNVMNERYGALILGVVSGAIFIYAAKLRGLENRRNINRPMHGRTLFSEETSY